MARGGYASEIVFVSIQEPIQKFGGLLSGERIEEIPLSAVPHFMGPQSPAGRGTEEHRKVEKRREVIEQEPFERTTVKG